MILWAPKWSTECKLDGGTDHLCLFHPHLGIKFPTVFRSHRECREFIEKEYGYIRKRPDLRRAPHCWRVPQPVKVTIAEQIGRV